MRGLSLSKGKDPRVKLVGHAEGMALQTPS